MTCLSDSPLHLYTAILQQFARVCLAQSAVQDVLTLNLAPQASAIHASPVIIMSLLLLPSVSTATIIASHTGLMDCTGCMQRAEQRNADQQLFRQPVYTPARQWSRNCGPSVTLCACAASVAGTASMGQSHKAVPFSQGAFHCYCFERQHAFVCFIFEDMHEAMSNAWHCQSGATGWLQVPDASANHLASTSMSHSVGLVASGSVVNLCWSLSVLWSEHCTVKFKQGILQGSWQFLQQHRQTGIATASCT